MSAGRARVDLPDGCWINRMPATAGITRSSVAPSSTQAGHSIPEVSLAACSRHAGVTRKGRDGQGRAKNTAFALHSIHTLVQAGFFKQAGPDRGIEVAAKCLEALGRIEGSAKRQESEGQTKPRLRDTSAWYAQHTMRRVEWRSRSGERPQPMP